MLRFLILLLSFIAFALAAKPMESIKNYNVILVHGAADKRSGLDWIAKIRSNCLNQNWPEYREFAEF